MRTPRPSLLLSAAVMASCFLSACSYERHNGSTTTSTAIPVPKAEPSPPTPVVFEPIRVDLRPKLQELGLTPRPQGHRGTCSIFTTCEAIEYAMAMRDGACVRQSPEFVNWAGAQMVGGVSDGNFFHNALNGVEKYGICDEKSMPYSKDYDAKRAPTADAMEIAAAAKDRAKESIKVHWIVPWNANSRGVKDEAFAEIKRVLRMGYPIAAGSGHSRLLVGYVDDPKLPGGGKFLTEDSALNRFDEVTYEFVQKDVCDVFWVEAVK